MSAAALVWLVRDAFRHARASGLLALAVAATMVVAIVGASARFENDSWILLGGWLRPGLAGTADAQARELLFGAALAFGDFLGPIVALLATASFLPAFLDPSSAAVVFSKPVSRSALLLGRVAGALAFAAITSLALVAGFGLTFGWATGTWATAFWLCWPIFFLQFLGYYSVSVYLAVSTGSTIAAMLGSTFFWLMSWAIGFGRHTLAHVSIDEAAPEFGRLLGWVYYLFPKPVDFSLALHQALGVNPQSASSLGLRRALEAGDFSAGVAAASAVIVAAVFLALSTYEFKHTDY